MDTNNNRRTKELIDLIECKDKPVKRLLYEFAAHFWVVDDQKEFELLLPLFVDKLKGSIEEEPSLLRQSTIFEQ